MANDRDPGSWKNVSLLDEDVDGGADDDDNKLGKNCAMELEQLIVDFA